MPRFGAPTLFVPTRRLASTMPIPSTMNACQIQEQGELDVIQVREVDVPQPGKGQVLYKVQWAGVNFIDTYQRGGLYKLPMPYVLGNESAGVVVALGEGVTEASHDFKVGDKVAVRYTLYRTWAYLPAYTAGGSFAEYAVSLADKTVKIPESMSTKQAATGLLQGLTGKLLQVRITDSSSKSLAETFVYCPALTFVREAHPVQKGEYILVQAAAGGLGGLLVQFTTSTEEKARIARDFGADHVILYSGQVDVVEEVYKITGGEGIDRGVHAVFDGVGKDTFEIDFDLVRRKGTIVSCGNASGAVPPFSVLKLGPKNHKVLRPVLNQYVHTKQEFQSYSRELFGLLESGKLRLSVYQEFPLSTEGIRQAQIDIMGRKSSGKLLVKVADE
ncbi:BQ2448_5737 [Microbotryum intermedium]|uniref:BQ2448_5737 protein n=1 Tax=Microbotryum intermedium TaxID=269621 RepID=A0A238F531_9BASI|nr:BQ2448_5737 [Microbotryum intermedium]